MKRSSVLFPALVATLAAALSASCGDDAGSGGSNGGAPGSAGDSAGAGDTDGLGGEGAATGEGGAGAVDGGAGGSGGSAEELPVTLNFAAKVGTEDFSCASTYAGLGADDSTVEPVDFKFYVHDVRLIDEAGAEVPVTLTQDGVWQYEGVALLDFEDKTGRCTNGTTVTNDRVVGTVAFGTYVGVAFKLGVPFELNHTEVTTAPSPLNLSSMFWSWNSGHLFLSVMNSTEVDASTRFGTLVHFGSTGCMGDAATSGVSSCSKPNRGEYVFPSFTVGSNVVVADMQELLRGANLKTDLCHSFQAACQGPVEALGVDWTTGAPSVTQTFFRVE